MKDYLDPRTKLLLLLFNSFFGFGGETILGEVFKHILIGISLLFLWLYGKNKHLLTFVSLYIGFYILYTVLLPNLYGILNFLLLFSAGIVVMILPTVISGQLLVSTTKMSDLLNSLYKLKIPHFLVIPIAVIIRFFPVVFEEYKAISSAMKMRGLRFGGRNSGKILEYKVIPLIICSVKAGEELSASALSRGLGSPISRSESKIIRFSKYDYFVFSVILVFLSLFLIERVIL